MPTGHVFAALRISGGAGSPRPHRLSSSQSVSASRACNKSKRHCSTTGTKKGKKAHRDSDAPWFKKALTQRVKIQPVIGQLKAGHRMGRCRYKGSKGDTTNVVWATAAWNMRKVTRLDAIKQEKAANRKIKCAA